MSLSAQFSNQGIDRTSDVCSESTAPTSESIDSICASQDSKAFGAVGSFLELSSWKGLEQDPTMHRVLLSIRCQICITLSRASLKIGNLFSVFPGLLDKASVRFFERAHLQAANAELFLEQCYFLDQAWSRKNGFEESIDPFWENHSEASSSTRAQEASK